MQAPPHAARVYIVDDDVVLRQVLRGLFLSAALPVQAFSSGPSFLEAYDNGPGCLILDVDMPGVSGLDVQDALLTRGATLPVIMMTGFADAHSAVRAFRHGAWDFLEKPIEPDMLVLRVRTAMEQDAITRHARDRRVDALRLYARLTKREVEVLNLVVGGHTNKGIADLLRMSPKTVESHRARIMRKLHARSVPDLVRMSVLLEAPPTAPNRFFEAPVEART